MYYPMSHKYLNVVCIAVRCKESICYVAMRLPNMLPWSGKGRFYMAMVDEYTESAQVGDMVEALHAPLEKLFEIPVAPFWLDASHMVTK